MKNIFCDWRLITMNLICSWMDPGLEASHWRQKHLTAFIIGKTFYLDLTNNMIQLLTVCWFPVYLLSVYFTFTSCLYWIPQVPFCPCRLANLSPIWGIRTERTCMNRKLIRKKEKGIFSKNVLSGALSGVTGVVSAVTGVLSVITGVLSSVTGVLSGISGVSRGLTFVR